MTGAPATAPVSVAPAATEETEESKKSRRTRDPEIHAMEKVLGILEDLDDHDAARRVMVWVKDRYTGPTQVNVRPGAVPIGPVGVSAIQGATAHPSF